MESASKSASLQASIIVLASVGIYFNTLFNGFVYDDVVQVVENPWIREPRFIAEIFSSGAWGFNATETNYYRPIMHVIYMFTYALFELEPWGFHLVNIVLHSSISILIFLVTRQIMSKTEQDHTGPHAFIPFATAMIFSVHPVHTEAVAWIGGIPDLSFSLFFLLSFYLYLLSETRRASSIYIYSASIGSFFLATLCKEPAVTLPLILLIYDCVFNRSKFGVSFFAKRHLSFVLILAIYFPLRLTILGGFSPVNRHADLTLLQTVLNVFPLFAKYILLMLAPVNLTVWHPFHPIQHAHELNFILALLFSLSCALFGLYALKANKLAFFSLGLLTVTLLPALYLPGTGENPFAERYLYLPSFGFAILASLLMAKVSSALSNGKIIVSGLCVTLLAAYAIGTISRNLAWKDGVTFWTETVRKAPEEPLPHFNLGSALDREQRIEEAIVQYKEAIALKPAGIAYRALGNAYYRKGMRSEAALEYVRALELEPGNAELQNETGVVFMEIGHAEKALDHFTKAVALVPDDARLRYNFALALSANGRIPEAIDQLKIAVELDPSQNAFRNALRKLSGFEE